MSFLDTASCSSGIFPCDPCQQLINDTKARLIVAQNRLIRHYEELCRLSPHVEPVKEIVDG
jgi:hypothetical protein